MTRCRRLSPVPWQCVLDRRAAVASLALSPLSSSHPVVQSGWDAWETGRRVGVRRRTGVPGSRATRLDERDGLRSRCEQLQSGGRTPSGSRGGRIVPHRRRTTCDRHDSGLSLGKGWHRQKR